MQTPDLFAMLPIASPQAQGPGRGPDAAGGKGGLFGPVDGAEGLEAATGDGGGFAEALLAVLAMVQPQQPQQAAPVPKGDGEVGAVLLDDGSGRGPAQPQFTPISEVPVAAASTDDAAVVGDQIETAAGVRANIETPDVAPMIDAAAPAAPEVSEDFEVLPSILRSAGQSMGDRDKQSSTDTLLALASNTGHAASPKAGALPRPAAQNPTAALSTAAIPSTVADGASVPILGLLDDQAAAPASAAQATAVPASVPTPAALPPAAPQGRPQAKVDTPAATDETRPANASPVVSAAKAEETLTANAVSAAPSVDTEDAPVADDTSPTSTPVAAHTEAKGAAQAPAFDAPKATPQTVALLSAHIAKNAEGGKSTRFEVQLEPAGLGKVDVRIEIRPSGDIKADLSFESPLAAAELRARSGELQAALERAGFDTSKTQLSFNSGGQNTGGQFADGLWRDQQQQQQQQSQASWKAAAFMDLADAPANPVAAYYARERDGGVDVRI